VRPLKPAELLDAWERGRGASSVDRALMLLAHACPESSWDGLAALPVGRRDARLLTLREWMFGPSMSSVASCPACGSRLELNFTVAEVRAAAGGNAGPTRLPGGAAATDMDSGAEPDPVRPVDAGDDLHHLAVAGYDVTFRLPTSADLVGLGAEGDPRLALLSRCVLDARRKGRKRSVSQLPTSVIDALADRMSEADPGSDVRTALTCPDCGHGWQVAFDIVTWFWAEIEDWAHRILREVHTLASAYGWREAEILALSPWRRQLYLRMVGR
jgi:hypothetical protein